MSLFNRIQKALGFAFEDDPQENDNLTVEQNQTRTFHSTSYVEKDEKETIETKIHGGDVEDRQTTPMVSDNVDPSSVFKGVVEFLNRELPPYLRKNLDEEGQRRYILENIEDSLKQYIRNVGEAEKKKVEKAREIDRERLKKMIEGVKERLRSTEEQLTKEAEKSLSAERQKRAMALRISDLESRIGSLEAEKEQFELENRSLLNKLRVLEVSAQLNAKNTTTGQEELENKAAELENKASEMENKASQMEAKAAEMEKKASEMEAKAVELKAKADEMEAKASGFENKVREMTAKIEELTGKLSGQDSVINDSRNEMESLRAVMAESGHSSDSSEFEFISFDDMASTPTSPDSSTPVEDNSNIEINDGTEKVKKRRGRPKKSETKDKDDMLTDTDWLIEASEHMDNPDRVVNENNNPAEGLNKDFPSQMSLW